MSKNKMHKLLPLSVLKVNKSLFCNLSFLCQCPHCNLFQVFLRENQNKLQLNNKASNPLI